MGAFFITGRVVCNPYRISGSPGWDWGKHTVDAATLTQVGIPVAAGLLAMLARYLWHRPPGPEGGTLVAC
jgi:hypothetical protein